MSKLLKVAGIAALLAVTIAATSVPAQARWHGGGGWHGGGWHGGGGYRGYYGGGWGWGPGFGLGLGLGTVWGYPYYYGGPYYTRSYYGGSACGWSRTRVWRYNHWAIRRVWRCW